MIDHLENWLASRLADTPPSLVARVQEAIGMVDREVHAYPEKVLWTASLTILHRAMEHADEADPLDLLAADALMTWFCEFQAELEPQVLFWPPLPT